MREKPMFRKSLLAAGAPVALLAIPVDAAWAQP
jgi:hypothetical protein